MTYETGEEALPNGECSSCACGRVDVGNNGGPGPGGQGHMAGSQPPLTDCYQLFIKTIDGGTWSLG